jgi:hypothetical protein
MKKISDIFRPSDYTSCLHVQVHDQCELDFGKIPPGHIAKSVSLLGTSGRNYIKCPQQQKYLL